MTEELDGCPFECEICRKSDEQSLPSDIIYMIIHILIEYPPRNPGLAEVSELNIFFPWSALKGTFAFLYIPLHFLYFCSFAQSRGALYHS